MRDEASGPGDEGYDVEINSTAQTHLLPHKTMLRTAIIADDHALTRRGLQSFLSTMGVSVLASADNGSDVLPLVHAHEPDLLVVDINMPGRCGLDVLRDVEEESPQVKTMVVSMHADPVYVATALDRGASAYVIKTQSAVELATAIHVVAAGETYVSPTVDRSFLTL